MKKYLLTFFFISYCAVFSAQVQKFKALSVSSRYESKSGWTDWSQAKDTDILMSINIDDNKIKIYSEKTQIYDIVEYHEKEYDEDGDETIRMYSEDQDGNNCYIDLMKLNSQNGRLQLYVRYKDMNWMYNIYSVD